jgi:hypothetical protein
MFFEYPLRYFAYPQVEDHCSRGLSSVESGAKVAIRGERSVSGPGRFIPEETASDTQWMVPRDVWTLWKNLFPLSNSDSSVVHPVASRYRGT